MVEHIVDYDVISYEDPTSSQNEIQESEVAYRSPLVKKRRRHAMDKGTCWEVVAEV